VESLDHRSIDQHQGLDLKAAFVRSRGLGRVAFGRYDSFLLGSDGVTREPPNSERNEGMFSMNRVLFVDPFGLFL
jgi:hypothetical protein